MIDICKYNNVIVINIRDETIATYRVIKNLFKKEDIITYSDFGDYGNHLHNFVVDVRMRVKMNSHTLSIFEAINSYINNDGGYAGLNMDEYIKSLGL